ncbi:hypothetical protein BBW65_01460 [Helicobacter enhydrae]|uniref:Lipoprotein n=1 Tax=Helicobacter enhydrae TaxID=222136 RepID=A0A1B1U444_9HELI|nr:hypothetical protein [Helicobacter enhydrae]ANV97554.1 hypothetical protein BBW65_01460 [Helicobacter enhydrae]
MFEKMRKALYCCFIGGALMMSGCASSTQSGNGWDQFLSFFGANGEINPDAIDKLEHISGTKLLLFNTIPIKFYDIAIIRITQYAINIDLFQAGTPIGVIAIGRDEICYQGECAPKSLVTRKILGLVSYPELLDDIFLARDIFNSKGLRIGKNGNLIQRFLLNDQEIFYERSVDFTLFKNLTTGVTISIQKYHPPKM